LHYNVNMIGINATNDNIDGNVSKTLIAQQNVANNNQAKLQPLQKFTSKEPEYINGRLKEESRVNYETYYAHNEKTPDSYHPLVQYLDKTELKFYNDNIFYDSPLGFPTKT